MPYSMDEVKRKAEKIRAMRAEAEAKAPAPMESLMMLEAKFSKPKAKGAKPVITVNNNGWGKVFAPEQLTKTVIDSDLSAHAMRGALAKTSVKGKKQK